MKQLNKQYGNVDGYPYPGKDAKDDNKERYKKSDLAASNREYFESQNAFIIE